MFLSCLQINIKCFISENVIAIVSKTNKSNYALLQRLLSYMVLVSNYLLLYGNLTIHFYVYIAHWLITKRKLLVCLSWLSPQLQRLFSLTMRTQYQTLMKLRVCSLMLLMLINLVMAIFIHHHLKTYQN